jgi:hypothetical protein
MSIGMTNLDGDLQVNVGTLLGRELILVKKTEMEIQTWFLGFMIGRRKFNNDLVRELRYEEWKEGGARTCGIRFKYEGQTHVLIKAAHESDTLRTVVKIINVYKFSHSLQPAEPNVSNSM